MRDRDSEKVKEVIYNAHVAFTATPSFHSLKTHKRKQSFNLVLGFNLISPKKSAQCGGKSD